MSGKRTRVMPWLDGGREPPEMAGRIPPHDIDAEAAVLSACMLVAGALDECLGVGLVADSFYSDPHKVIYNAIIAVTDAGAAVDVVSIASYLRRLQQISKIGGSEYLGQIVGATPDVANVRDHAKVVLDFRRVRMAIETAHHFAAFGYDKMPDPQAYLDDFEQAIFAVAEDRLDKSEMVWIGETVAANREQRKLGVLRGLQTGFDEVDRATGGLFPGDVTVVAARPGMGKTGWAMCIAGNVADQYTEHHVTGENGAPDTLVRERRQYVAVFSLEMPKEDLATRMVAWRGDLDVKLLREGDSPKGDAGITAWAEDRVATWPMFVEDSSDSTISQIRAKSRRLQARAREHGGELALIVIDYLQLMEGGDGKGMSREQEVSKNSRGCKKMAKEIGVPVILLSQLNRSCETRGGDKRPKLSDLRECLPVDEWVYTPNGPMRIGDQPNQVIAVSSAGAVARQSEYIHKRYNKVFEVRTQFGTFRATARHRVLTGTGYKEVRDLETGRDVVAAPKVIPHERRGHLDHGRLLGWLIGNGYLSGTPSITLRKELRNAIAKAVSPFGVQVRPRKEQKSANVFEAYLSQGTETGSLPNPLMQWLRELGLEGCTSHAKHVPAAYLGSSTATHRALLRGLWESDGCVTGGVAKYSTVSEVLARQVAWLLLTIGVRSTVTTHDGIYSVRASRCDATSMAAIVAYEPTDRIRFGRLGHPSAFREDPAPAIFTELAAEMCPRNIRRFQRRRDGSLKAINKSELMGLVQTLPGLSSVAESPYMTLPGIGWGRVESVTALDGDVRVADLSVPGPNNFVAGGVVVHNSGAIEQDADVIVFLYRDDYYDDVADGGNSGNVVPINGAPPPPAGLTEAIIAKQRNGPTGLAHIKFNHKSASFSCPNNDTGNPYER